MDIRNKILDAYYEYRKIIVEKYENPKYLQVVIQISPIAMSELLCEERFIEKDIEADCYFTSLIGKRTPIIITHNLPEEVEFTIQSQSDYERQEKERILKRFCKMFEEE